MNMENIQQEDLNGSINNMVFICAVDNDLLMLEGTHYNWRKKEWLTVSKEEAELKFWKDMIVGQSGDNIKGLKGKGIKYAEKLLVGDYQNFRNLVNLSYMEVYKDETAYSEFDKNYHTLKILDSHDSFIIPEINIYNKEEINIWEL